MYCKISCASLADWNLYIQSQFGLATVRAQDVFDRILHYRAESSEKLDAGRSKRSKRRVQRVHQIPFIVVNCRARFLKMQREKN